MTDLSTLVVYDNAFPVKLVHPQTGKEIGITINIVSFDSERVVRANRIVEGDRWRVQFQNEDGKLTPEQVVDFIDRAERATLVAAIDSWDFGDHSFDKLDASSEPTEENRAYLINHPNAKWVRAQLLAAGNNLGNFTPVSAAKPAKK